MKSINNMNSLEMTMPVGYLFCWRPVDGGPDLSTAQKVHDYFGFGEWKACYGRNLLLSSKNLSDWNNGGGSATLQSDGYYKVLYDSPTGWWGSHKLTTLVAGEVYTLSGWCKGSHAKLSIYKNDGTFTLFSNISETSEEKLLRLTFSVETTSDDYWVVCYADYNTVNYYKNIMLERGTEPTDWTPAPEDISSSLAFLPTDYKCYRRIA